MTRLVIGVCFVNLGLLLTGYAVLAGPLRGRSIQEKATYAGVALLLGAALVPTLVFFAVIIGGRATLLNATLVAVAVSGVGVGLARYAPHPRASSRGERVGTFAALVAGALAAVCTLGLVGGFRSSPWLDDAWGIWLPKGLAVWHLGLDERLFVPNSSYVGFGVPDYPLWWSILTSLNIQAVGSVDVRAITAQLALLAVAFIAASARLLWGTVRPSIIAGALALVAGSAEFWRQTQGGVADLPMGMYVAIAALGVALWVARGDAFALLLASIAGVAATQVKTEGIVYVLLAVAVAAIAAPRRRPLVGLGLMAGTVVASAVPWLAWRAAHDVPSRVSIADALNPSLLADEAARVEPTVHEVFSRVLDPTSWVLIVPLLLVAGVLGFWRDRRLAWLLPSLGIALALGFLVLAYWSNPDQIDYLLTTSAYRTVDPVILSAGLLLALEAEVLLHP